MTLKESILDLSRQATIGTLSSFFDRSLNWQIEAGLFPTEAELDDVAVDLTNRLVKYREETGVSVVVLGMSGGVDSTVTAALFKRAGWRVIGVTMPIHQNPEETDRGIEACEALGIEHQHIDLSHLYLETRKAMTWKPDGVPSLDPQLGADVNAQDTRVKIRLGNIRARLRMITLYNLASAEGGLVASTDNFSELAAGFWTLHGDVGDVSPIQSLLKSWEVPYLAKVMGVPERTWRATPTDGLGISNGDEAQLGGTYLEWDIMMNAIIVALKEQANVGDAMDTMAMAIGQDEHAQRVFEALTKRVGATWFKRMNPVNLQNKMFDRYADMAMLDNKMFVPASLKATEEPITAAQA